MTSRVAQTQELMVIAQQWGYHLEGKTRRGHLKWRNQHGLLVVTVSDMSHVRTRNNAIAELKRRRLRTREDVNGHK